MNKSYNSSIEDVIKELSTDSSQGLSSNEIAKRAEQFGKNKLEGKKQRSLLQIFFDQFKNFLLIILIIAGAVSFFLGEEFEAIIILAVVLLNCVLGAYQENKASDALNALRKMASPHAKVIRDAKTIEVLSEDVSPGDIILLDAGDSVCADIRLIETSNLKINESALTGESEPDSKDASVVLADDTPLGDLENMAFMGTVITYGRGKGIVVSTGMDTQMGKIAHMLTNTESEKTPLQKKLDDLGKKLGIVCIVLCLVIFGIGMIRGMEFFDIFMISVSLAVAAIPEGLTIVVTVILALGMQKMVKSNAIIKTLGAVETLGSTTVICSDKTGTLTQNKMTVVKVFDNHYSYDVNNKIAGMDTLNSNASKLVEGMVLCSDATLDNENVIGDPTEGALISLGNKLGWEKDDVNNKYPRVNEVPFDSDRKLMSTLHKYETGHVMYTKGAFDQVLKISKYILDDGKVREITAADIEKIQACNEEYATHALRALALAYKETGELEESDLIFVGLVGMIDPPREEAKEAIKLCKQANISVKMITGDHKITAAAIGKQLGIVASIDEAIEGQELDALSDDELREVVNTKSVFARVSPEHKVRLVKVIRQNDNIVAMTGDGVNDAPSLKQADIGIAMGITGTDVSKEASDMILTDDNFASIVHAVEEGRTIYNNIRKVVAYLLSCNIGEILIIFLAMAFGMPMPLGALQLISINLITDTFPAFALGMEKKEGDVMNKPPRDPNENIIDLEMIKTIGIQSAALTIGALASFIVAYYYIDPTIATTSCFVTLVLGELLRGYSARSESVSIFKMKIFENSYLNKTVLFSLAFLLATVYVPGFNTAFGMQQLTVVNFLIAAGFSIIPFIGGEISKKL